MTDGLVDKLDLTELGLFLRELRTMSRRLMSERSGLSVSHVQKLEEGRSADVTVVTLCRAAQGYGISPYELMSKSIGEFGTRPEVLAQTVKWLASDPVLRPLLKEELDSRIVVEAEVAPESLARMDDVTDELVALMERMSSLVSVVSSMSVAMQSQWGANRPPSLAGLELVDDVGQGVGPVDRDQGDDGPSR